MKNSIIIPTFNTAHYLPDAIDSVLKSTMSEYEIIIIDDESTDNTKEIVIPYLEKYSSIKYIYQKNKGLAGARNTGIENSSREYLVFLDSDDIILPDKLQIQSAYLDSHPEIDVCYSKSINFIENDIQNTFPAEFPVFEGDVLQNLWFGNFLHVNSVMVRREKVNAVGNFNPTYRELEDWDLWLRMALSGSRFAHIPETLSMVRVRKTSMTVNQAKMDNAMVKALVNIYTLLQKSAIYNEQKKNYFYALGLFMIKAKSANFFMEMNKGLSSTGISFFSVYLKLILKKAVNPFLKNQNTTTKKLEEIWNEH